MKSCSSLLIGIYRNFHVLPYMVEAFIRRIIHGIGEQITYVCVSGKIYFKSAGDVSGFRLAKTSTRCEIPTYHIHIQSIYNNLKRLY